MKNIPLFCNEAIGYRTNVLKRERRKNEVNIEKMCEEYYSLVLGFLLTLTGGDPDLAEELTQETFLRAIKNSSKFKGESKVSTWLCQIAKYTFWQYIDKKNKRMNVPIDEVPDIPGEVLIEDLYIRNETNKALYECIENLGSPAKEVVLFRLKGDLSFKEIGELMNKPENWARITFYRAKVKIGKEMSDYE